MAGKTYNLKFQMSDGSEIDAGTFEVPNELPDGGAAGEMLVKQSDADGDATWQRTTATDGEALAMLSDMGLLPAVTSDGAILTSGDNDILLWW